MSAFQKTGLRNNLIAAIATGIVVIVAFTLRLVFIDKEPYWIDETYTTWFSRLTFHELLFWAPTFESHPPFYYLLVKMWNESIGQYLPSSERFFSLALSALLLITSHKLLNRLSIRDNNQPSAFHLTLLLCFSPIIGWYAIEARPYILFALSFSIALIGFFEVILKEGQSTTKSWVILSLGVLLTNWSHSTGPLHSLVIYLALLCHVFYTKDATLLKNTFISASLVFLFSIPLLYMLVQQIQNWASTSWIPEPTLYTLVRELKFLFLPENALGPLFSKLLGNEFVANMLVLGVTLVIPAIFLFGTFVALRDKNLSFLYLVLFCLFAPLICYAVSLAGPNILLGRTLIPVIVPYFVLLAISITSINSRILLTIIFGALTLQLAYSSYTELQYREKEPWHKVYDHLLETGTSNDLVLLFPNSLRLPLEKAGGIAELKPKIRSLLDEFPAIGKSTFYPVGTPSVPGFREEDIGRLEDILAQHDGDILLITRLESLFDPDDLVQQTFSNSMYNKEVTLELNELTIYEFNRASE